MKPIKQNRFYKPGVMRGNCFAAVIASVLEMDIDEVIQIQEWYALPSGKWHSILDQWLKDKGYDHDYISGHLYDGSYYLVDGMSPRGVMHVCIYQNGKLVHDPHPSDEGLKTEEVFHIIEKSELAMDRMFGVDKNIDSVTGEETKKNF